MRSDLLPGLDLVTEEVEPGVHRVVSDGRRDPSRAPDPEDRYLHGILDGNIVAGLDGSVWVFGPDGFFRLGNEGTHRLPKGTLWVHLASADIDVGPDGTLWLYDLSAGRSARARISSYDGQAWSTRWRGDAGQDSFGVECWPSRPEAYASVRLRTDGLSCVDGPHSS